MTDAVGLGIDVGTTRVKAEVVGFDGRELHSAAEPTPWQVTADGPQLDLDRLGDLAISVAATAGDWAVDHGHRVAAIAVTGMAETGALLDGRGRPIAPGFAWHHTLGDPGRVQHALGRDHFIRTTGRDASISPSIIKLDMLRANGHEFRPGQRWLNIPDYVAWRLCGVQGAEISASSRTGLVDIPARAWWDEALEFLGAGRWLLPGELLPGGTLLGRAVPELPGSLRGAVVATGGHDHPVASLGAGAIEPGTLSLSLGTAEAQLRFIPPTTDPDLLARLVEAGGYVDWHPLADRYTVVAALPTGVTLARLAGLLGCADVADRLRLSAQATDATGAFTGGLHLDDVGYDSFSIKGIADGVTRPDLWRRAMLDLIDDSTELMHRIDSVLGRWQHAVMFGGWTNDPLVVRMRAEQLGPTATIASLAEPGAVGAALLAAKAAGEIDVLPVLSPSPGP